MLHHVRSRIRPAVIAIGIGLLGYMLIADLYRFIRVKDLGASAGPFAKSDLFFADVAILVKQIDHTRNRAVTDMTVTVRSLRPNSQPNTTITNFGLMIDTPTAKERRIFGAKQRFTLETDDVRPNGESYSKVIQRFENVDLFLDGASAEQVYPFDTTEFTVAPAGCVNTAMNDCSSNSAIPFQASVRVDLDDQLRRTLGLRVRQQDYPDRMSVSIGRETFIRMSAIYFLVLAAVFLVSLYRQQAPKDLLIGALSLLAALWGIRQLLVPTDVKIFPTLIDYFVLFYFGVIFIFVITRLPIRGET